MSQVLLTKLAPKLRKLDEGGYARAYRTKKSLAQTHTHSFLKSLLDSLGISYREGVPTGSQKGLKADFLINGTLVFVDKIPSRSEMRFLGRTKRKSVVINRERFRSDRLDSGLRVLGLGEDGGLQTIFIDDPSFNFDYAHILPKTQKCSVMHGHTSSALVEIIGHPVKGMVVDFGIAKGIIRQAVGELDHKLFINKKYVTKMDSARVALAFNTVHGEFSIQAPRRTTVLLAGEATVENLAKELVERITPKMPQNVTAVGVYVYEGLNKGSHLLAQIQNYGVRKRRRKQ